MKILNSVSLLLLWSSAQLSYGNVKTLNPFVTVNGCEITNKVTLKNPPKGESSGKLPLCFGPSAKYVMQNYICEVTKVEKCSSVPPDSQVSVLSAIGWANKSSSLLNKKERQDYIESSYANIRFGGSGTMSLINSAQAFTFKPESCYPIDKINNKFGSEKEFLDRLAKMNQLYLQNRNSTEACESCLIDSISANLDVNIDSAGLRAALQRNTFEEFLYRIVFNKCDKELSISPPPTVETFPKIGETVQKKSLLIDKIAEKISPDRALLLENICLLRGDNNECLDDGKHSVAIAGYGECCRPGKDCRKLIKVQNSWGEDWQKANNDGWVDAETLVNNVSGDPVIPGTLTWYK